jgi:hypothetical protein
VNPVTVALVFAVVGIVVLPIVLSMFKTRFDLVDVLLASVLSAVTSLIPTIGEPLSLIVMIAVLYWRIRDDLFPDILVAVGAARLAMVPALLAVT